MPKFNLLRSYTVVESHEVEAKTEDEAIKIIEKGSVETHQKSYDRDYTRDDDGDILYTLNDYSEEEDA
tara:strand:- start:416 stop:619 length:204 start_codon:yes stop_codon:yes gene_type:complete